MRTIFVLLVTTSIFPGCHFKGANGPAGGNGRDWPLRPVSMRVHPFTSLTSEGGAAALDARIELFDPAGDGTKGIGTLRFELYAEAPTEGRQGDARRLFHWDASIATLAENREHWDPITRTYRFLLKLDRRPPDGRRLRLHVQLDAPTGERLTADGVVEPVK
jgi:hypothetical protein